LASLTVVHDSIIGVRLFTIDRVTHGKKKMSEAYDMGHKRHSRKPFRKFTDGKKQPNGKFEKTLHEVEKGKLKSGGKKQALARAFIEQHKG